MRIYFYGKVKNSSLFSHIPSGTWHRAGIAVRWIEPLEDPLPHVTDPVALSLARKRFPPFGENEFTCHDNVQRVGNHGLKREKEKMKGIYFKNIKREFRHLKYIERKMYNYFVYMRINISNCFNTYIIIFFFFNLFCKLYDIQSLMLAHYLFNRKLN